MPTKKKEDYFGVIRGRDFEGDACIFILKNDEILSAEETDRVAMKIDELVNTKKGRKVLGL